MLPVEVDDVPEDRGPVVALVRGPKRVGKSTFGRATVNRLLRRYRKVAWLESDLGQGEFGSGGAVGIWTIDRPLLGKPCDLSEKSHLISLGPAFTHPLIPLRAHYLGTYTPLTCPDEYMAAIRSLVSYYRYEVQYPTTSPSNEPIPLVINTQGWVKGLGEDLLHAIESIAETTHIFAFDSQPSTELPGTNGAGWTTSPPWQAAELPYVVDNGQSIRDPSQRLIEQVLQPAPTSPLQLRYTSADFRILSMMTYFHHDFGTATWNLAEPLLAVTPWLIELGTAVEQVILMDEGADGVSAEDLPSALNGSVVALLESDESLEGPVYTQGRPYPPLDDTNFLGLALIRAVNVNPSRKILLLLSSLPPSVLAKAKIIVKNGAIELPVCGMLDWRNGGFSDEGLAGMSWGDVPFLDVSGVEVVGGDRRRFRRNLMRKGM